MAQSHRQATGLEGHGIVNVPRVYWNLSVPALYEEAVRRREGAISADGSLVCRTGQHTGRSPNDKFIVREPSSEDKVWWSKVNRPIEPHFFDLLHQRMVNYVEGKELFAQDCYAGADARYRLPVRIITEQAWHSLFARHMFIEAQDLGGGPGREPEFTVIDMPGLHAEPAVHGTNSEVFIVLNFARKMVLIGGTSYAGEIKKSIFTVMNYVLPLRNVMSMHCSANVGAAGDVALFFGLSGPGKTTLSSDPERQLIGDDEHGWSEDGVFNVEGGCYAKMIRLSAEAEPQIHAATRRFGTVLENVRMDAATRAIDLNDDSLTENTRGAYPLKFIDNSLPSGLAGHPRNIVMLTADAFGVLPPIARLSPAAAMYHFLSGYTAKVAGTEKGVTEPKATFSTCFGAPFMVLHPTVYARFLGEKIARHDARVWLVNTGWTGGPYGIGSRLRIVHTRAMIRAALGGALDHVTYERDAVFNLDVPRSCPDVPVEVLTPRNTWKNPTDYDTQAHKLARMFVDNFKSFEGEASADIKAAGPHAV
jgi:phosphoenolpyruvate carboxykinase (ATP)